MAPLIILADLNIPIPSAIIIGAVLSVIGWLVGRVVWANDKEIKDLKNNFEAAKEQSIRERRVHSDEIEKLKQKIFDIEIAREKQTTEIRLENQRQMERLKQDFTDGTLRANDKMSEIVVKLTEFKGVVLNLSK